MKGDFLGFSFDGIHCSQLGITHVSSSDRYDEDLFPEVKDKTIEIPNNHGEYYYGSTYGTRTFDINIAYDSITETQLRSIRRLFGTQKICELIFDERPYKVYYAKIESPIQMSYVCFDEREKRVGTTIEEGGLRYITDETTSIRKKEDITPWVYSGNKERIYKGEGSISLVCYQPFAHQLFKIKELYQQSGTGQGNLITTYNNVDEWIESSGILTQEEWNNFHIDQVISTTAPYTYAIPVYNPGDLDVGFCLYIPFVNGEILPRTGNSDIIINGDTEVLILNSIQQKGNDLGILINTRTRLIEGVTYSQIANVNDYRRSAWQSTGNLYNEYIKMGEFPYIKRNDWKLDNIDNKPQAIYISCAQTIQNISIYYDYLYF